MGGQGRREDLEGFLDLDSGRAVVLGAAQKGREHVNVVGAEDGIHPRRLLDDAVAHLLGEAASNRDLHPGPLALDGGKLTEVAKEAGRRILTHGARIDDDNVGPHVTGVRRTGGGLGNLFNGDEAGLLQQTRHAF